MRIIGASADNDLLFALMSWQVSTGQARVGFAAGQNQPWSRKHSVYAAAAAAGAADNNKNHIPEKENLNRIDSGLGSTFHG